jgi:predicted porin
MATLTLKNKATTKPPSWLSRALNPGRVGLFIVFGVVLAALLIATQVKAADLGGNCCSDLEERIAELEATAARKGNRKMSLQIYGQVSESLQYFSVPGFTHLQVQSNGNRDQETMVGFAGQAKIDPHNLAGFVLEIDVGLDVNGIPSPFAGGNDTNGLGTRQAFVYWKNDTLGGVGLGLQKGATYGVTDVTGQIEGDLASTNIAHTKISLRPLVGSGFASFIADPWNGVINDSVKYSSPVWAGFSLSASWGDAINAHGGSLTDAAQGSIWDVALRFNKDIGEFRTQAAIGYRDGTAIQNLPAGFFGGGLAIQDVKVFSGSAGVQHAPTGLFVNGSYGNMDLTSLFVGSGANSITAYELQVGDEMRLTNLGHTTVFAEWGQYDLSHVFGTSDKPQVYGVGVVQAIDPAAMSLFLSWQRWSNETVIVNGNVDVIQGGAKIQF